jgi:flagellar hook-associated protein 1 FlgK
MAVGLLGSALSGLQAFQSALSVTGHNISNANTEGYNRQRVELVTRPASFSGGSYTGNGVKTESIERIFDQFVTDQMRDTTSSSAQYDTFASLSSRVSDLLGNSDAGLNAGLESFFNAVQDVATNPASIPARQLLLSEADSLVGRFSNLNARLDSLRDELNGGLVNAVEEINGLTAAIAQTNKSIVDAGRGSGQMPNDLMDKRDQLINELSELVAVRTVEQDNGAVNVFAGTGQPLVTGFLDFPLGTHPNNFDAQQLDINVSVGGSSVVITDNLSGGKLGAMLDFHDQVLEPTKNAMGRIAITLASEFNRQHMAGTDLDGNAGTNFFGLPAPHVATGALNSGSASVTAVHDNVNLDGLTTEDYVLGFDGASWSLSRAGDGQTVSMTGAGTSANPFIADGMRIVTSGVANAGDRFEIQPTRPGAAGLSVQLSSARQITAGTSAAPGDNRNALLLADLQTSMTMENGTATLQDAYGQLVGELGTRTRSAQLTADAQSALLSQAKKSREQVSGVNLDEEAANLLRYQQAYQAVARVITVADETFQSLLAAVGR